jgi:hypothetical protein
MTRLAGWLGVLVLAVAMVPLAGCGNPREGYAFSQTYDSDLSSVAVLIFQNTTPARGVEVELARAIAAEIRRMTPWAVTSAATAQATLSGTITAVEQRRLSLGRDAGLAEELGVTVVVDFELRDNRTGRIRTARRAFAASDTYVPARGVGERLEVGQTAAVQRLARDLVAELRSGW